MNSTSLLFPECFCGSNSKKDVCSKDTLESTKFSCQEKCGKRLNCSKHICQDICHPEKCKPCSLSPEVVKTCPCGKTPIYTACEKAGMKPRISCTDPIPVCGQICGKYLSCGSYDDKRKHTCQGKCHLSKECAPCTLTTSVKCRCGNKAFDVPCKELKSGGEPYLCEKKCTRVTI